MATETPIGIGTVVLIRGDRRSWSETITSESRTHWHVNHHGQRLNIPKNPRDGDAPDTRFIPRNIGCGLTVFLTDKAEQDAAYVGKYRHVIANKVQCTRSADMLRKVAAILGMETP